MHNTYSVEEGYAIMSGDYYCKQQRNEHGVQQLSIYTTI